MDSDPIPCSLGQGSKGEFHQITGLPIVRTEGGILCLRPGLAAPSELRSLTLSFDLRSGHLLIYSFNKHQVETEAGQHSNFLKKFFLFGNRNDFQTGPNMIPITQVLKWNAQFQDGMTCH